MRPQVEGPPSSRSATSPADKVVIAYLAIIAALILVFYSRVPLWWALVPAHCIVIAAVLLIERWLNKEATSGLEPAGPGALKKSRLRRFFRSWYPLFLIPMTYKELSYLIPHVNPTDLDWKLE